MKAQIYNLDDINSQLNAEISALKEKLGDDSLLGELAALRKRVVSLENQLRDKSDSYNELLSKYQSIRSEFDEAKRQASVNIILL